jgi:hypothetical protein
LQQTELLRQAIAVINHEVTGSHMNAAQVADLKAASDAEHASRRAA